MHFRCRKGAGAGADAGRHASRTGHACAGRYAEYAEERREDRPGASRRLAHAAADRTGCPGDESVGRKHGEPRMNALKVKRSEAGPETDLLLLDC